MIEIGEKTIRFRDSGKLKEEGEKNLYPNCGPFDLYRFFYFLF